MLVESLHGGEVSHIPKVIGGWSCGALTDPTLIRRSRQRPLVEEPPKANGRMCPPPRNRVKRAHHTTWMEKMGGGNPARRARLRPTHGSKRTTPAEVAYSTLIGRQCMPRTTPLRWVPLGSQFSSGDMPASTKRAAAAGISPQ